MHTAQGRRLCRLPYSPAQVLACARPPRRSYVTSDQPQSLRWTELQSCHTDEPAFTL